MTDARCHYYVARCMSCDWFETYNGAQLKAKKDARLHAKCKRMHETVVMDLTRLETIARYRIAQRALFTVLDDEPPF